MITESAEHESNRGETHVCQRGTGEVFPIFGETAAAPEPGECALDHPPAGQNLKAFGLIRAFDNLGFDLRQDFSERLLKSRPLIAAIGEQLFQKRVQTEQRRKNQRPAVAILNIRRMHDGVKQKTYRIDEDVPLFALDLFPRVIAVRVDPRPPFSADLTLWLSMTQAVGLASRPIASRHLTYNA